MTSAGVQDTWVQDYLDHVAYEKRLSPRTHELYRLDLIKLKQQAQQAGIALDQVQPAHVRRWVANMHAQGRSARGIALILSGWRGFYKWLGQRGCVSANPIQDVRPPKAGKPLPKALPVDEAVQLASFEGNAATDPALSARDHAMVELLYGCGIRLGELLGIDVLPTRDAKGWIDQQSGDVHILGKGSKRRVVPLGSHAAQAVQAWLQHRSQWAREDEPAMWIGQRGKRLTPQQVRVRLKRWALQAGLSQPVHPHMLRHSFASHVLQSSADLRGVQELLGHANISTTQVYTRLDFQHLARVYDQAHPRARKEK